eukprot:CAMPEP_0118684672 /NCGR_PEP_ID=MMETSP0800-20121206/6786_1 /TAXON_ID=210618 ORGANISM="Striatella unipunctata, Strain CCMP2910" /NCGR_SAMPLE_ID=MMETSP0800 /ASSEMBLY_ACC=CAM_ASM_000638 /LENGTH=1370 /DNA_ID=CAMNT_0006581429 /DNA_START=36 /DNA_END=4148 /DNA_ORIENTATION=+
MKRRHQCHECGAGTAPLIISLDEENGLEAKSKRNSKPTSITDLDSLVRGARKYLIRMKGSSGSRPNPLIAAVAILVFLCTITSFVGVPGFLYRPLWQLEDALLWFYKPRDSAEFLEHVAKKRVTQAIPDDCLFYQVCNGFGNQMLSHVANVALAVSSKRELCITDAYIVNGVQNKVVNGGLVDILPTKKNTIPLSSILDLRAIVETAEEMNVKVHIVPLDYYKRPTDMVCNWLDAVGKANDDVLGLVLQKAIRPSVVLKQVMSRVIQGNGRDNGVCVHHRDGQDWHDHCRQWENIPDGVWRHNCLNQDGRSLPDLLNARTTGSRGQWIYYVGDHAPPQDLIESQNYVMWRKRYLTSDILRQAHESAMRRYGLTDTSFSTSKKALIPGKDTRDLDAAVDFFVCNDLPQFVGNSVSSWSAMQLALRNSEAGWYNSRSIPLSEFMGGAYRVPIVYTFTETTSPAGKHMLKISILSVRKHVAQTSVHILYHCEYKKIPRDEEFVAWLKDHDVTIHFHEPEWADKVELMRLNGDPSASHLFAHKGNYLGTWQRIDIPEFITSEYVLLLDYDTVVIRPFSFADFGLDITPTLAFSAEMDEEDPQPFNAGVALMNVPFLRETREDFLEFIWQHVDGRFKYGPSDQGAYNDFYRQKQTFLDRKFNVKPYWHNVTTWHNRKIIHFHGMKPLDIISYWFGEGGGECNKSINFLCEAYNTQPFLCPSMQYFAKSAFFEGRESAEDYCNDIVHPSQQSQLRNLCFLFLQELRETEVHAGSSCKAPILAALKKAGKNPQDFPNTHKVSLIAELPNEESSQHQQHHQEEALQAEEEQCHSYIVCDSFDDQILSHIANIAYALTVGKPVCIFDAFIFHANTAGLDTGNYRANEENTVPLSTVIDLPLLLETVRQQQPDSKEIPFTPHLHEGESCNWINPLMSADSKALMTVLRALQPSKVIKALMTDVLAVAGPTRALEDGVCVHHRDGQDWHEHCRQWENIPDGVWRGNCLNEGNRTLTELLRSRVPNPNSWIYYVGDHTAPEDLVGNFDVVSRQDVILNRLHQGGQSISKRELDAAVDFFVCSKYPRFVGNSASSWSALQIALRNSQTTWYNGRSIPMAEFIKIFYMPIVYTYSELTASKTDQYMLQLSILSAIKHVGSESIHVVYYQKEGSGSPLVSWLRDHGVIVHLEVDTGKGLWETRLDVPKYLDAEYVLWLNTNTMVMDHFTFADFGLEITPTFAWNGNNENPNVMLMHLPYARESMAELEGKDETAIHRYFEATRTQLDISFAADQKEDTQEKIKIIDFGQDLGFLDFIATDKHMCQTTPCDNRNKCTLVQQIAQLADGEFLVFPLCENLLHGNDAAKQDCVYMMRDLAQSRTKLAC